MPGAKSLRDKNKKEIGSSSSEQTSEQAEERKIQNEAAGKWRSRVEWKPDVKVVTVNSNSKGRFFQATGQVGRRQNR